MAEIAKAKHIRRITNAALKAAEGDYSAQLTIPDPNDELAPFTEAINKMIRILQAQSAGLQRAKAALRESEETYRRLKENIPGMVFMFALHPDGHYSFPYVNGASRQLFGIEPKDLMQNGTLFSDLIHPDDKARFYKSVEHSAETLQPWREELRYIVNGEVRWYDCISRPERQTNGDILWDGIILEITDRKKAQEKLYQSEGRYRRIVETAQEGVWMIDAENRTTFVNRKMAAVLGYRVDEMRGRSIFSFMDEEWQAVAQSYIERRRHGIAEQHDFKFRRKDGSGIWTMITTNPIFDDAGEYTGALAIVADISERKRIEDALQKSNDTLGALIQSSPLAIIAIDTEGKVMSWNEAAERMFGWQEKEVLGRSLPYIPEYKLDEHRALRERVLRGEAVTNIEVTRQKKDGSTIDISISAASLRDAQGCFTGIMSVITDITDRRKAEKALEKSARLLMESQEVARLGHYTFDIVKGSFESSKILDDIFGVDAQFQKDMDGLLQLVHLDHRDEISLYLSENVLKVHQPFDREYKILRFADNQERWVHCRGRLEFDDKGKPLRLIGTIQDITDRKYLEEQLLQSQKMEAIGQLAGGIAHDFNNMLSVILGYAELIRSRLPAGNPLVKDLLEIEKAALHSRDTTRQLLAFSRKQIIMPQTLNLNDIISATQKTISRLIGENINLSFHPGEKLGNIRFDPSQIDQILVNLALNSRDAMPEGGKLTIETANVDLDEADCRSHYDCKPGQYILLAVSDDGIGIEKEILSHIFEPFFTTKEVNKGTGLGLATVYGIVKQNGGFIDVNSEPGRGTSFKIYIPRTADKCEATEESVNVPPTPYSRTVLLVEDDDMYVA